MNEALPTSCQHSDASRDGGERYSVAVRATSAGARDRTCGAARSASISDALRNSACPHFRNSMIVELRVSTHPQQAEPARQTGHFRTRLPRAFATSTADPSPSRVSVEPSARMCDYAGPTGLPGAEQSRRRAVAAAGARQRTNVWKRRDMGERRRAWHTPKSVKKRQGTDRAQGSENEVENAWGTAA
jgi:hypothetical protein